jgi:hypothetical protein
MFHLQLEILELAVAPDDEVPGAWLVAVSSPTRVPFSTRQMFDWHPNPSVSYHRIWM